MKKWLFFLPIVFALKLSAQTCEVELPALKGNYEGECKGKKANGHGVAKGEDEYVGEFKDGYPDGFGKYTWKNGDWYEGNWKKGMREGQGKMRFNVEVADSVRDGFWKKDRYFGKFEKPYVIHSKSSPVSIDVRQGKSNIKDIKITIEGITAGSFTLTRGEIPKITITNLEVAKGSFIEREDQNNLGRTTVTTLHTVEFPIRLRLQMGSDMADVEIMEEGNWQIAIRVQR